MRIAPSGDFSSTGGQDTGCNVSRRHEMSEVKSPPRLVDSRFIATKRAESLRVLFILGSFSEIPGVAVKHACHVVGPSTAGRVGYRLLSGR
jgi:hypothetical protein